MKLYSCLFPPLTQVVFLASVLKEHFVSQLLTIPQRLRRGIELRKKGSAIHQVTLIISVNVSGSMRPLRSYSQDTKLPITHLLLIFTHDFLFVSIVKGVCIRLT